jgi:hypothetical protein
MPYADPERQREFDARKHRERYARRVGRPVAPYGTAVPDYSRAHRMLRAARGPATDYRCAECGGEAHHWAYDHSDPEQIYGMSGGPRPTRAAYSLDHSRYRPLCRRCHALADSGRVLRGEVDALRVALWLTMLRVLPR